MAVLNAVAWHHEVYPALMWTFQEAGADVTAFVSHRVSISEVIKTWYGSVHLALSLTAAMQSSMLCSCLAQADVYTSQTACHLYRATVFYL